MKRKYFWVTDVTGEEGRARLEHYNEWLMDNSRPLDSIYAGFPGDREGEEKKVSVTEKVVAVKAEPRYNRLTTNSDRKDREMSKLNQAIEIVKAGLNAGETKSVILASLVEKLQVTRANAFVYFAKATKATGQEVTKTVTKKEKKSKVFNPVTETSVAVADKKLKEIDKMIAGLKEKAKEAEPFDGLAA